jgi:hypothetical protein
VGGVPPQRVSTPHKCSLTPGGSPPRPVAAAARPARACCAPARRLLAAVRCSQPEWPAGRPRRPAAPLVPGCTPQKGLSDGRGPASLRMQEDAEWKAATADHAAESRDVRTMPHHDRRQGLQQNITKIDATHRKRRAASVTPGVPVMPDADRPSRRGKGPAVSTRHALCGTSAMHPIICDYALLDWDGSPLPPCPKGTAPEGLGGLRLDGDTAPRPRA